ncbi:hypothetical protein ABTL77_19870, partial [Acinetobacter baumannii]
FEDRSYKRQPPLAFDPARAAIDFMRNGQALVTALDSPNASSFVHEFAHMMRRIGADYPEIFDAGQWHALEEWAGVKDGRWHTEAEEKFATA